MKRARESHRGDLTERLILIPLKLAEHSHTRQELAEFFGVDAKTISRDMTVLSQHHAILYEKDGREVRYFFSDNYQYRSPNFTPSELATLLLAQQAIAITGLASFGTPFAGYGKMLLQKVRSALPQSLRDKLDALATIFGSAQIPAKDYAPHATTIDQLTTAAVENRRVKLLYYSLHKDRVSERELDPYAVYFDPDGATLKVIGYDHRTQEIRPFAVDHIRALNFIGQHFTRPSDWNLQEFLRRNCFNGIHGEPITVRLRAFGTTARVFAERQFHPSQQIIEKETDSITIEMTVARGRGLVRFILSWMPDVEVLCPTELKQEIIATLQQALTRPE